MKSQAKKKVFVAMSGGVDSSVTAALLKGASKSDEFEKLTGRPTPKGFRGFDVRGIHMKMWFDPLLPCTAKEDRLDAMRVAAHLGIPFETWDFTEEYRKAVVEYMVREYATGRTPNPDIMCNREIKFGIFLKEALKRGADYVATGHYVKLVVDGEVVSSKKELQTINYKLLTARDGGKDQSYFLWTLTQDQLRHCLFPIGEYKKSEVRGMARKFGLPTAEKLDSQGVCFIGEFDMREFLQRYIPLTPGVIATAGGREIGEHEGLPFYTIGQRQGIGIGGGIPFYVAEKDFRTNTLVVAEGPYDEELFRKELVATDVNWISGIAPKLPLQCEARIRYRQPLQPCTVEPKAESRKPKAASLKVTFSEAQRAVTPGQSVVFYQGEEMLGGGVIY